MREILFRGKWTYDNKKWIYGYAEHFDSSDWNIYDDNAVRLYHVDPDTIGQYTGWEDMNGRKIFEGDILRCNMDGPVPGERLVVQWSRLLASFNAKLIRGNECYKSLMFSECEVIGNIYDNPELIEGKSDG